MMTQLQKSSVIDTSDSYTEENYPTKFPDCDLKSILGIGEMKANLKRFENRNLSKLDINLLRGFYSSHKCQYEEELHLANKKGEGNGNYGVKAGKKLEWTSEVALKFKEIDENISLLKNREDFNHDYYKEFEDMLAKGKLEQPR
jgi:hypothetical protein